jgi:hypothetical protein
MVKLEMGKYLATGGALLKNSPISAISTTRGGGCGGGSCFAISKRGDVAVMSRRMELKVRCSLGVPASAVG